MGEDVGSGIWYGMVYGIWQMAGKVGAPTGHSLWAPRKLCRHWTLSQFLIEGPAAAAAAATTAHD